VSLGKWFDHSFFLNASLRKTNSYVVRFQATAMLSTILIFAKLLLPRKGGHMRTLEELKDTGDKDTGKDKNVGVLSDA
jgi:hypothetical protein